MRLRGERNRTNKTKEKKIFSPEQFGENKIKMQAFVFAPLSYH
jgi:hypothetical protein